MTAQKKILFVTNLAAFYKVNLYSQISQTATVAAIVLNSDRIARQTDFFAHSDAFQIHRLEKHRAWTFLSLLWRYLRYDEVVIGGWDRSYYWLVLLFGFRRISLALESSIYESNETSRLKRGVKQLFLSRVHRVYASGTPHRALLESLGYRGEICITQGVGIIQYPTDVVPRGFKKAPKKFLFIGRLDAVKGIGVMLAAFRALPTPYTLTIVGDGSEKHLLSPQDSNIHYAGYVSNDQLSQFYQTHDMLLVPSLREPWGLVVEEAIANHLPVLVSDKVGSNIELVQTPQLGMVVEANNPQAIVTAILQLNETDNTQYLDYQNNLAQYDLHEKDRQQIRCYL